jgi:DNA gyrase subunit A
VTSFDVVDPNGDLFVLHEKGWGKRTSLDEYTPKGRYTQGIWATDHNRLDEVGPIVAARVVHARDQITIITSNGIMLRTDCGGNQPVGAQHPGRAHRPFERRGFGGGAGGAHL